MGFQLGEGAFLVRAHQARIAGNIARENRRQATFHLRSCYWLHGSPSDAYI
jgi:hypothetical protein